MNSVNDNIINDRLKKSKIITEQVYGAFNPYLDITSFASPGKVIGDYNFLNDYYNSQTPYVNKKPYFSGMNGQLYTQTHKVPQAKDNIPTYNVFVDYGTDIKSNKVKFNIERDDIYE